MLRAILSLLMRGNWRRPVRKPVVLKGNPLGRRRPRRRRPILWPEG